MSSSFFIAIVSLVLKKTFRARPPTKFSHLPKVCSHHERRVSAPFKQSTVRPSVAIRIGAVRAPSDALLMVIESKIVPFG